MKKTIPFKLTFIILSILALITGCENGTGVDIMATVNADMNLHGIIQTKGSPEKTTGEDAKIAIKVNTEAGKTAQITVKNNVKTIPTASYDNVKETKGPVSSMGIENLKCIKDSEQVVVAAADSDKSTTALVHTYEKVSGKWQECFPAFRTKTGRKGFTHDKKEGDEKSPIGAFELKTCYSRMENPGTKLKFIRFGENAFWVDDSSSKYYNTFQVGPSNGRWNSAEDLYRIGDIYKYFILVEYNTADRIPGKGSAIFMHIWEDKKIGTSGCTSMSEENLLRLIKWLDPQKKPKLIQCPLNEISKM